MSDKLYDERDAMALDEAGDYYSRHVFAMTAESLYSKSAIAAELGHRDMLIDLFKGERDHLERQLEESIALGMDVVEVEVSEGELAQQIADLENELEIQRGLNNRLESENQALSARVLARVEELQVAVQARLAAEKQRDELLAALHGVADILDELSREQSTSRLQGGAAGAASGIRKSIIKIMGAAQTAGEGVGL